MSPTNNCQRHSQPWVDPNSTVSTGPHLSLNTTQALAHQNDQFPPQQPLQQPPSFSFVQSAADASFTAFVGPTDINGQCPTLCSNGPSPSSLYPATPIAMSPSPQFEAASEAHSPARSNASHEPEGKRTGRPAYWTPDRCRQVIREYVYSKSTLTKVVQLFHMSDDDEISEEAAKGKVAAVQKKIHVLIGKDARPLRPREEAYAAKRRQFRGNPRSHTQRHDRRSNGGHPVPSPQRQPTELKRTIERTLSSISSVSMRNFNTIRNFTVKSWGTLMNTNPPVLPRLAPRFTTPQPPLRPSELVTAPGDLLNIDTRAGVFQGSSHEEGVTYRAVASELDAVENLWVKHQTLTDRAYQLFQALNNNYSSVDISQTDCFGNTVLHFLAARPDCQVHLLNLLQYGQLSPKLLASKNTAGQTFLHVLSCEWFINPTDCLFIKLLTCIADQVSKLVQARDVYGRTVLHRIVECIPEPENALDLVNAVIFNYGCNNTLVLHRSAFGDQAYKVEASSGYAIEDLLSQTLVMEPYQLRSRVYNPFAAVNGVSLEPRDRYMRVIEGAIQDPFIEDGKGRGPLHCLAELAPELLPFDKSGDKSPSNKPAKSPITNITDGFAQMSRSKKRKAGDAEASPEPDASSNDPSSCLSLVKRLLDEARCSPSAYDCAGNTALMAFISTVEDRSQPGLQAVLKTLIEAAQAEGLLDARNRAGETALVLAARLGKKTAVRLLVEAGANWHVRDHHGWGLIRIINREISWFKHDPTMYPGIEISWAMLARKDGVEFVGMDEEAVLYPDVCDEWGVDGRVGLGAVGGDLLL